MENNSQIFNLSKNSTPLNINPQIIYEWKAPLRAYKKRAKNVLRFYIAVAVLLTVIVYFLGDRVLLLPIWATLFLFYMLTITPPPIVTNRISKFGIETAGITLRWDVLSHFYFIKRFGFDILTLVTQPPYNMHAYLVLSDEKTKKDITRILTEHIVFQEIPKLSLTDRLIKALTYLIPDDEEDLPAKIIQNPDEEKVENIKDTLATFFQKRRA